MTMKTDRFQIVAGLVALAATVALAQQAARPADVPNVPPRGPLTVDAAAITEILGGIKAPPGFEVKVFAAPPIVNYPACITASLAGELFVCVDRNSSLQADPGMGSVLRLVDKNNDGQADEYTVFATMDSPRGAVFDGDTLFVVHPPSLTAYRDGDGDGIAEESRTLVRGLGFGLDFRGADHTVNGVEIGVDGWLYIAVGDYGIVKAVGSDGREIQMRGGGNVRVRPDGTGLEIYSRGTRNDYDVAIDPYLNLFARGNTNDGGGWDIRLNHFVAGANYGYPSLFRNFGDEVVAPLADYGGGSGTGHALHSGSGPPGAVRRHAVLGRLGDELRLSSPADASWRVVYCRPGGVPGLAAADRHRHRRGIEAVRGKLEGRAVSLWRRADRIHRPPDLPRRQALADPGHQGRERRATRRARRVGQSGAPPLRAARAPPARADARAGRAARETRARRRAACGARVGDFHIEATRRCRLARRAGASDCRSGRACLRAAGAGRPPRGADRRLRGSVRSGAR